MKELSITIRVAIAGPEDNHTIGERGRLMLEKYLDPVKLQATLDAELKVPVANISVALNVTEMEPEEMIMQALMSQLIEQIPDGASDEHLDQLINALQSQFGNGVEVGIKRIKVGDNHQTVKQEDLKRDGNVTYLPTKDKPSIH